jgi:hypothetical protein
MAIRVKAVLGFGALTALFVAAPMAGCTTVLGNFEIEESPLQADSGKFDTSPPVVTGGTDADTPDGDTAPETGGSGGQGDAGSDGSIARPCAQDSDCPALDTEPAGCATAACKLGSCFYNPVDKDSDTHPVAGCKAKDGKTAIPAGDDCADNDPTIFPGAQCSEDETGKAIVFPNGKPVGLCKAGAWDCTTGKAVCKGAVAPQPAEDCTAKNDANCNGIPDDGCAVSCTGTDTQPCGNVGGLPAPCQAGTRTCGAGGVANEWGPCVGNVEPKARDCSSSVDNDCANGPDNAESACQCPGPVPQGASAQCPVPNAKGVCALGSHVCQASPDGQTGVFGPCTGPAPGARSCNSAKDYNCDGIPDELEAGCGSPCNDPAGSGTNVAAAQKFGPKMYGCRGNFAFNGGAACRPGSAVCGVQTWANYIRSAGSHAPNRHYWVAENLNWGGSFGIDACWAAPAPNGNTCGDGSSMHVCALGGASYGTVDVDGNVCNWTGCEYGAAAGINDYLGGCVGNTTAGALCCLP